MTRRNMFLCISALALSQLSSRAQGHDLWLERDGSAYVLRAGHVHSSHAGEAAIDYPPEIVREATCIDAEGTCTLIETPPGTSPVRFEADCAALYVLTSTGYWTKTPYGTRNVPKTEAQQAIRSWLSYDAVKRIDAWSEALARPATRHFEVTPLTNPLDLREGRKLDILVTLDGRPIAGAAVAYGDETRAETGEDGRVRIKIRHDGFQSIHASVAIPSVSTEADETIHACALNFELVGK